MKKVIALLTLLYFTNGKAQLGIDNLDKHPDIKTNGVYVVLNDTTSATNKMYWRTFKTWWTYSPVMFAPYANLQAYIKPNTYFFSFIRNHGYQTGKYSPNWEADYSSSLTLWLYKGKKAPTDFNKDEFVNGDTYRHISLLGHADLFSTEKQAYYKGNYRENGEPHLPKQLFYNAENNEVSYLYFNLNEGLLKNYLQCLSMYAAQPNGFNHGDFVDNEKLEALKHDTLFIPDFVFTVYALTAASPDVPVLADKQTTKAALAKEKLNIKNTFLKYKHPYKVITAQELSDKLMQSTKPFYYLTYTVNYGAKSLTILSSQNGAVLYTTYSTKGERDGFKDVITDKVREIKLEPQDINVLVDKMETK